MGFKPLRGPGLPSLVRIGSIQVFFCAHPLRQRRDEARADGVTAHPFAPAAINADDVSLVLQSSVWHAIFLRSTIRDLGIMPLSIKDPDADRLARALAQRTGETLTEAVIKALRERLERELRKEQAIASLVEDAMEIGRHCASLPLLDQRRPDEILGYDDSGHPQ
jgi:antitoxin VapB